jgi:hypothetical protein
VKIMHSDSLKKGQLTLSQRKMKNEDDVAHDEDNYAVRTSVSQDQVTVTLCAEDYFSGLSIWRVGCSIIDGFLQARHCHHWRAVSDKMNKIC